MTTRELSDNNPQHKVLKGKIAQAKAWANGIALSYPERLSPRQRAFAQAIRQKRLSVEAILANLDLIF